MTFLARFWVILAFGLGVFFPVFAVLREGVTPSSYLLLGDPVVLSVVRATLWQALLSTVISLFLGLPLGLALGRWVQAYPRSKVPTLLALPYGIPTLVAAMAWVMILGRNGVLASWGFELDWAYSLKAVIVAHVFLNIPLVALWISQARAQIPVPELEAARVLGASSFQTFKEVIFPKVKWAWASAGVQVFSLCGMSFALVLILGGGPPVQTLETLLYSHLRYGTLDISSAVACAIWELGITVIPWVVVVSLRRHHKNQNQRNRREGASKAIRRRSYERSPVLGVFLGGVGLFFISPYLTVLSGFSFSGRFFEAPFFTTLKDEWMAALKVSFQLAALSSGLAVTTAVMAVLATERLRPKFLKKASEVIFSLPSGISVLVLALGFWLAYERWIDPFEGSLFAMAAIQATFFFPMAYRILWPVSGQVRSSQLEAAFSLGASPLQGFWHVEWPKWKGPVLSAIAAVAGGSLAELGAVSLFYSERLLPLPLLISRWMVKYRFEEAQGLAALLLILSFLLIGFSLSLGSLGLSHWGEARGREV